MLSPPVSHIPDMNSWANSYTRSLHTINSRLINSHHRGLMRMNDLGRTFTYVGMECHASIWYYR